MHIRPPVDCPAVTNPGGGPVFVYTPTYIGASSPMFWGPSVRVRCVPDEKFWNVVKVQRDELRNTDVAYDPSTQDEG